MLATLLACSALHAALCVAGKALRGCQPMHLSYWKSQSMPRTSPVSLLGPLNSLPSQPRSRVDHMHQKHKQSCDVYILPHAQICMCITSTAQQELLATGMRHTQHSTWCVSTDSASPTVQHEQD